MLPSYLRAPGAGEWQNNILGAASDAVGTPALATCVAVDDVKATYFSASSFPDVLTAADAAASAALGFMAHSSLLQVRVCVRERARESCVYVNAFGSWRAVLCFRCRDVPWVFVCYVCECLGVFWWLGE